MQDEVLQKTISQLKNEITNLLQKYNQQKQEINKLKMEKKALSEASMLSVGKVNKEQIERYLEIIDNCLTFLGNEDAKQNSHKYKDL